jgi:hypothetical protein
VLQGLGDAQACDTVMPPGLLHIVSLAGMGRVVGLRRSK